MKEKKTCLDNFKDYESEGQKVLRLLKSKNIKSPSTENKILIVPGFYVVPRKKLTTNKEIKDFRNEQIKKYKLDRFS